MKKMARTFPFVFTDCCNACSRALAAAILVRTDREGQTEEGPG